ncbi:MAG: alanine racemase [Pseudomonadota bacterium]
MATGQLHIDLGAIARNWKAMAKTSGRATCGAVIKADAYGLGVQQVAPTLAAAGARTFFVAVAEEGAAARAVLGEGPEICVFGGHMAGDAAAIRAANLVPMLNSIDQVRRHLAELPDHAYGIQLDTGMNRLGLEPADWAAIRADVAPRLIMSHLACADAPDHPQNAAQLATFHALTAGASAPLSLAATGGALLGEDYHFDLTRPGIGTYGGFPFTAAEPVLRLRLPVVQIRRIEPGEAVGYGAAFTADRTRRIATVSSGYADGLIRAMSDYAALWDGDRACPLAGRVSMDLMGVDVTECDHDPDFLDILNETHGIDALAEAAGTIGYEILTSLGPRYARHYHGAAG